MTLERAAELVEHVKENPMSARVALEEALSVLLDDLQKRVAALELAHTTPPESIQGEN